MVHKWRLTPKLGNFGDELSDLLLKVFRPSAQKYLVESDKSFFLIGSTISDHWLKRHNKSDETIHYWGCGFRDESLSAKQLKMVRFHGVRGHLTRSFLEQYNFRTHVIGDTAFLLPLLVKKGPLHHKKIFMPHILDPKRYTYRARDLGVDEVIQPDVQTPQDVINIVHAISGAGFVLSGAMHAGIVACAYGRPFGFFDSDFIDCKPKYGDFLSSIGLTSKTQFLPNFATANSWYKEQRHHIKPVRLSKILRSAPAKIKPELLIKSLLHDVSRKPLTILRSEA